MLSGEAHSTRPPPAVPTEVLQRLAACWGKAVASGREHRLQTDIAKLCAGYESDEADADLRKRLTTGSATLSPSGLHCTGQQAHHINELPPELLARILRFTLHPAQPGCLCHPSYTDNLTFYQYYEGCPEVVNIAWLDRVGLNLPDFSRQVLTLSRVATSLSLVLVCKRWHHVVRTMDVVRVLATAVPLGLPSNLRTLLLRLETITGGPSDVARVMKSFQAAGLHQLENLICCRLLSTKKEQPSSGAAVAALSPVLPTLTSLTRLEIGNCPLGVDGARALGPSLSTLPQLRILVADRASLGCEGTCELAPHIGRQTGLQELSLAGNAMCVQGLKILLRHCMPLRTLTLLDINDNGLGDAEDEVVSALAEFLKDRTSFKGLMMQEDGFSMAALNKLLPHLASLPGLERLIMAPDHLSGQGAASLVPSLRLTSLTALTELFLSHDFAADERCMRHLSPQLARLRLKDLNFSCSSFERPDDILALASCISDLTSLTALDLSVCSLGLEPDSRGALVLFPNLSYLSRLERLSISFNFLKAEDLRAFTQQASCLQRLRALDLADNDFGDDGAKELSSALSCLSCLEILDLGDVKFTAQGMRALAPALGALTRLQQLALWKNRIGDEGALELMPFLATWPDLCCLSLDECDLTLAGKRLVAAHFTSLHALAVLGDKISEEVHDTWAGIQERWKRSLKISHA